MNKSIFTYFFLALILSCDNSNVDIDTPIDPNINNQFIPLEIGNYWIYSSFRFDENEEIIENSESIDSIVVVDKIELDGRESFLLETYSDGNLSDSIYYSFTGDRHYQYIFDEYLPVNDVENQWIKIIDISETNWLQLKIDEYDENIIYENSNYSAKTDINLFVENEGFDPIELIDTSFNVFTFEEKFDSQSFANSAYQEDGENVDLIFYRTQSIRRHFRDSLGLVAQVIYNRRKRILHNIDDITIREENEFLPGKTSILIRFKIN